MVASIFYYACNEDKRRNPIKGKTNIYEKKTARFLVSDVYIQKLFRLILIVDKLLRFSCFV